MSTVTTTLDPEDLGVWASLSHRESRSKERDHLAHELFSQARSCTSDPERTELLRRIIEMHIDLAHTLASRYRSRGLPADDLRQVAALALIRAAHNYDVTLGHDFLSYAVPSIRGELRKHFRDCGWMIRPPRRIQELQARISLADTELTQQLGRSPRPSEIAHHLGEPPDEIIEALASHGCFVPASLEHPVSSEGTPTLGDTVIGANTDHLAAEARAVLRPALRTLPERDRELLSLRFIEDLTQHEIAARIGRSQMAVSRHLTRILAQLRNSVGDITNA